MNLHFDTAAEARDYFAALGAVRLPVIPETFALDTVDDCGTSITALYRKSGANQFTLSEHTK